MTLSEPLAEESQIILQVATIARTFQRNFLETFLHELPMNNQPSPQGKSSSCQLCPRPAWYSASVSQGRNYSSILARSPLQIVSNPWYACREVDCIPFHGQIDCIFKQKYVQGTSILNRCKGTSLQDNGEIIPCFTSPDLNFLEAPLSFPGHWIHHPPQIVRQFARKLLLYLDITQAVHNVF